MVDREGAYKNMGQVNEMRKTDLVASKDNALDPLKSLSTHVPNIYFSFPLKAAPKLKVRTQNKNTYMHK
jgi:hypothetical protein